MPCQTLAPTMHTDWLCFSNTASSTLFLPLAPGYYLGVSQRSWTVPSFPKYCHDVTLLYLVVRAVLPSFHLPHPPLYHLHTLIQHPAMPCLQSSRRYQMQLSLAILAALPKGDKNPKSQRRRQRGDLHVTPSIFMLPLHVVASLHSFSKGTGFL